MYFIWPQAPRIRQARHFKNAEAQARVFRTQFADDPKLSRLLFEAGNAFGGCVEVTGQNFTPADITYITNTIESQKSRIPVYYVLSSDTNLFKWFDRDQISSNH